MMLNFKTIALHVVVALLTLGFLVPPFINSTSTFLVIIGFVLAIASVGLIVLSAAKIYFFFHK